MSVPRTPLLRLRADTGISNTDRITSENRINVTGLVRGATWEYSIDRGRNWTRGRGNSFTVSDGRYTRGQVQVRQFVGTGVRRRESLPYVDFPAFTIDTTKPEAPTMALTDTGEPNDRFTRSGIISVGNIEPRARWQYRIRNSPWTNGTGTSFVVPIGSYKQGQVRVRQFDVAGNPSPENTSFDAFEVINGAIQIPTPTFVGDTVLPDGALGSDGGRGWTCTGLAYDFNRQFFWVGNLGQAKRPGSCIGTLVPPPSPPNRTPGKCPLIQQAKDVPRTPSIVAMKPNDNNTAYSITMELRLDTVRISDTNTQPAFPDVSSIQGITVDTNSNSKNLNTHSLWFVDNSKRRIHNIAIPVTPSSGSTVANARQIRTFNTLNPNGSNIPNAPINPNGLAYDPLLDELIVLHRTGSETPSGSDYFTISRVDKNTGRIIPPAAAGTRPRSYQTGFALGADQLFFDPSSRYLYMSWGADPGHLEADHPSVITIFNHDTGVRIGTMTSFREVYAAEGITILPTGDNKTNTIYFLSDNYWENFEEVPEGKRSNRIVKFTIDNKLLR